MVSNKYWAVNTTFSWRETTDKCVYETVWRWICKGWRFGSAECVGFNCSVTCLLVLSPLGIIKLVLHTTICSNARGNNSGRMFISACIRMYRYTLGYTVLTYKRKSGAVEWILVKSGNILSPVLEMILWCADLSTKCYCSHTSTSEKNNRDTLRGESLR